MGRKRRNTRKKQNKKNTEMQNELKFVFGIILAILLSVIIYGKSGVLYKNVSPILGGILGPIKYILPFGVFYLSIINIKDESEISSRVKIFMIVIILISSLLTIYNISKYKIDINTDMQILLSECYDLGKVGHGGGAIGAVIAIPCIKLLGVTGASIVLIFASILLGILSLGHSAIEYFENINANIESKKEEAKLRKEEKEKINEQIEKDIKEEKTEGEKEFSIFSLFSKKNKKDIKEENNIFAEEEHLNISMPEDRKSYTKMMEDENQEEIRPQVIRKVIERKNVVQKSEEKGDGILYIDLDQEYTFPEMNILNDAKNSSKMSKAQIEKTAIGLQKTLLSFGVSAKVQNVTVGPAVTRYELKPAVGVKVNRIKNLSDDIALSLAASTIRIEAPIPGKRAVGIEVPNEKQASVSFKEVIDTTEFIENKSSLAFALGKGIDGKPVVADLDKMRHLLIAGATGSGKSVCINTIINSIIYHSSPHDVKMIMVDPKVVELSNYNKIPHLCQNVVTDPEKASLVLKWCVEQMTKRYNKFAEYKAKDLDTYNKKVEKYEPEKQIPRLVVLVDELADLMMASAKDVEDSICRIAQMGRAAGIHLIIATQRPSTDVITGLIKANIPSRIAFSVTSGTDSRIILDMNGAEKLLGKGDMLYYPMGASQPYRVQGAFITDEEIAKIINSVALESVPVSRQKVEENFNELNKEEKEDEVNQTSDEDELLFEAIDTILTFKQASKTFLRRKFSIGDLRAGRIIDRIEELGVIGPQISTKPRDILLNANEWEEMKLKTWPELFVLEDEPNNNEIENKQDIEEKIIPKEFEITYDKNPNGKSKKGTIKKRLLDDDFYETEILEKPKTYYENGEEKIVREINEYQKTNDASDLLLKQINSQKKSDPNEIDPLLKVAVDTVMEKNSPESETIVNSLGLNPSRADKLIDQMIEIGIIIKDGSYNMLNITKNEWKIMKENF